MKSLIPNLFIALLFGAGVMYAANSSQEDQYWLLVYPFGSGLHVMEDALTEDLHTCKARAFEELGTMTVYLDDVPNEFTQVNCATGCRFESMDGLGSELRWMQCKEVVRWDSTGRRWSRTHEVDESATRFSPTRVYHD